MANWHLGHGLEKSGQTAILGQGLGKFGETGILGQGLEKFGNFMITVFVNLKQIIINMQKGEF